LFRKGIILFVVVFFPLWSHGQASRDKRALKLIEKHQYNSAFVLLQKSLANDSARIEPEFVLAQYYTMPRNQDFELDSAYRHILRAIRLWKSLTPREQDRLQRFPIDSARLTKLRDEIEKGAFEEARQTNSEEELNRFIRFYQGSRLQGAAIDLRNKLAFQEAAKANTPDAFVEFIRKYPDAPQVTEAREKYDYLIFQEGTRDRNLAAYSAYLEANPSSRYRREVEQNIFEIATADGTPASFISFLDQYPGSYFARRATDILFHILPDERRAQFPKIFQSDSIRRVTTLDTTFLVPFLQKGLFGLMNDEGAVIVEPSLKTIDDNYICGNIAEDLVVLPSKVITRDGKTVFNEVVVSLDDIGGGFLLAGQRSGNVILHKSGFLFPEMGVDDARLISGQLLAVQKNGAWGLFSLAGRRLLPYECQDISAIEDVVVMQINDRFTLSTIASLAGIANNQKGRFTDAFDEVRKISSNKIWIREKKYEGVLDQKLEILVAMDTHRIVPAHFGMVAISKTGQSTYNEFGEKSDSFSQIQVVNPWVAVKNSSGWMLYDPLQRIPKSIPYDSLAIHGPFAVGIKKDRLEIHAHRNPGNLIIVPPQEKIEYIQANDTLAYLLLLKDKKSSVYNARGEKIFTVTYNRIQSAGEGLFIVSNKEKKGLINSAGKIILPMEYDAIGTAVNGSVSVLRSMKFGLYDYVNKKLIKPEYEKNIVRYNDRVLSVFKGGLWGFVTLDNKPLSKIEYQEILPWTDSVALVKHADQYLMWNMFTGKPLMEKIKSFTVIRNQPEDRLFIIRQQEDMGVISNKTGFAIPMKFSDIVNVGSPEKPVYFTEKHVQEASLFVVMYYNNRGQLIRREVYEQDEYDQIYCNPKK
jgi:hypothetical protein